MKYVVLIEATKKFVDEIEVEASSPEEALFKIKKEMPKKSRRTITFSPRWVDEQEYVRSHDELRHEYIGDCSICKMPITNRLIENQPWTYDYDCAGNYFCYWCRPDGRSPKKYKSEFSGHLNPECCK